MSVPYDQADQSAFQPASGTRPAGWVVGMTAFAVVMMVLIGIFHAVEGLVALFNNERKGIHDMLAHTRVVNQN